MSEIKNFRRRRALLRACLFGCLCILAFTGCEAIFTTSPLSFLQRDPSKLPDEQKIAWAEAAWASGDEEAMAEAYAAIADLAAGSTDPELTHLAANLALELSGVTEIVDAVLDDLDAILDGTTTLDQAFLQGILGSIDAAYVAAAGSLFEQTALNDPDAMGDADWVMGTLCLIYEAGEASGSLDPSTWGAGDELGVQAFIDAAEPNLTDGNPAQDILNNLDGYIIP
jgi:hypothetical protein